MGNWVDRREEKEEGIHCIICDKLCKNAYGLANHVTKTHRIPFSEYKRRVLEAAEKECNEMKQIAEKSPNPTNVLGYFYDKYANIRHLFLLLKGEWKRE